MHIFKLQYTKQAKERESENKMNNLTIFFICYHADFYCSRFIAKITHQFCCILFHSFSCVASMLNRCFMCKWNGNTKSIFDPIYNCQISFTFISFRAHLIKICEKEIELPSFFCFFSFVNGFLSFFTHTREDADTLALSFCLKSVHCSHQNGIFS